MQSEELDTLRDVAIRKIADDLKRVALAVTDVTRRMWRAFLDGAYTEGAFSQRFGRTNSNPNLGASDIIFSFSL